MLVMFPALHVQDFGYSLSHPDCVTFRQLGNKKDGFPRIHINGSITVRLSYSKCPVEERLLKKNHTIRERQRKRERVKVKLLGFIAKPAVTQADY